jgi:hypothetical protein
LSSTPFELPDAQLLDASVRMPVNVVFRSFGSDGVALNLESGLYYGLNGTAGAMLLALTESPCVAGALEDLALMYRMPAADIWGDLKTLCRTLAERGLVEMDAAPPG